MRRRRATSLRAKKPKRSDDEDVEFGGFDNEEGVPGPAGEFQMGDGEGDDDWPEDWPEEEGPEEGQVQGKAQANENWPEGWMDEDETGGDDYTTEEWPEDDDEMWGDEDDEDFSMAGFGYQRKSKDDIPRRKIYDIEKEEPEYKTPKMRSDDQLSLLYDDFEVEDDIVKGEEPAPRFDDFGKDKMKQKTSTQQRYRGRAFDELESRRYVVAAEGIAVRTLPDERSPRTGEILRQGEQFTALEAVDGVDGDLRTYLRLPEGRGWVFEDGRVFPDFPAVKLLGKDGKVEEEEAPPRVDLPVIAVIGRPNVGKTTLCNRMSGLLDVSGGLVFDSLGSTTRDRCYKKGEHHDDEGNTFLYKVCDTGGMIFLDDLDMTTFEGEMKKQIDVALREAACCIFVVDSRVGPTEDDVKIAKHLKEVYIPRGLKVALAVSKCDQLPTMDLHTHEFWCLGLGEPIPISGYHGRGVWEVTDAVIDRGMNGIFPKREYGKPDPPDVNDDALQVCIVGMPNAGKSSLLNALVGEERSIVSDIPGTTTDAVDAYLETNNGKVYRFVDTAGIRRKRKIKDGDSWLSVNRAVNTIKRSDVALFCLDASEIMNGSYSRGSDFWCPTSAQRYVARKIEEMGCSAVIVLTKWDAIPNKDHKSLTKFTEAIRSNLAGVGQWAEVVSCSALTGQRLKKILDAVDATWKAHSKRVATPLLNEVVRDALLWRLPSKTVSQKKTGRIYYCSQVSVRPPCVNFFCNHPKLFKPNYKTFLENKLRQDLKWWGTPIQIEWRRRSEKKAVREAENWLGKRLVNEEVWR